MKKYFLVYIIGLLFASFLVSPVKADILPSVPTQNELIDLAGKPTHRVNIPGLSYTDIKQVEGVDGTYLYIPFMGEYISAIYRYLVIAAGLVAVIVIIVAGIQWTASGGNSSTIESAKKRITGALTGLGLAVGSYVILYTINPNLVNFQSLKIKYVDSVAVPELFPHGETPNANDSDVTGNNGGGGSGGYSMSNQSYTIPGTNETVKLSTQDVCYLDKLGKDQSTLASNRTKTCLFGSDHCFYVHKFIAQELQKRLDQISASTNPEILAWKEHLFNKDLHRERGSNYDPIAASGSFSLFGHGSDRRLIEQQGGKYGIHVEKSAGGIEVTAKANLVRKKMADAGIETYTDKNGVTRKTKKVIKHWVAADKHSWGLAFDIDYPHNVFGNKSISIPEAAANIITEGGLFIWGKNFKDPAHFEYSGKICN